jgi:hypothetical protein
VRARLVPSGISIRANTHNSRMVGDPEVIADVSLSLINAAVQVDFGQFHLSGKATTQASGLRRSRFRTMGLAFGKVAQSGSAGFGMAKFAFVEFPFALQSSKQAQEFWMVAQSCEVRIVAEQGVVRQARPRSPLQD